MNTICFHAMRGAGKLFVQREKKKKEKKKTRVGSSCGSGNEQP